MLLGTSAAAEQIRHVFPARTGPRGWLAEPVRTSGYAFGPQVAKAVSQTYAVEGQCYVLASCATVTAEMIAILSEDAPPGATMKEGGGIQ